MSRTLSGNNGARLLTGWRQIADYLGRDESTVKRWKSQRNMPVHRLPGDKRSVVYADPDELDAWLKGGRPPAEAPALAPAASAVAETDVLSAPSPRTSRSRLLILGLAALVILAGVAAWRFIPLGATTASAYAPLPEAEELYVKGVYLWEKRTPDSLREAVTLLHQAVDLDPKFARAYAGLANTYDLLREYSVMPAHEAYVAAVDAGRKAVALDPKDADAQSALAFAEFYGLREIDGGLARFEEARALEPTSPKIRHWLANALLHLGRFDEALVEIDEAQRLDPSSRAIRASKGLALFCTGHIAEAVALLKEMTRLEPDYMSPYAYLAYAYLAAGDYPAYLDALETAGKLREDSSRLAVATAGRDGFATGGFDGMVAAMLAAERTQYDGGHATLYNIARLQALTGDSGAAIETLRASVAAGEEYVMGLNIDPAFAQVRTGAAFRAFASEFGLTMVPPRPGS